MKTYAINNHTYIPNLSTRQGVLELFIRLERGDFSTPKTIDYIRKIFNEFDPAQIHFGQLLDSIESAYDTEFQDALFELKFRVSNKIDLEQHPFILIEMIDALDDARMLQNISLELKINQYLASKNLTLVARIACEYARGIDAGYRGVFKTLQKFRLLEKFPLLVTEMIAMWETQTHDIENDLPLSLGALQKPDIEILTQENLIYLANRMREQADSYHMAVVLYKGMFDNCEEARYNLHSKLAEIARGEDIRSDANRYLEIVRDRFVSRHISMPMIDSITKISSVQPVL